MNTTLLVPILILGVLSGFRAFTPFALVCWAAHFGWIPIAGTPFAFLGSIVTALIVSVIAIGELVNDKRPQTGNRTDPPALTGRVVIAALCGAAISLAAHEAWIAGVLVAAVGALIGTCGGFHARRALVTGIRLPAMAVALTEDAITIAGAYLVVSHLF